MPIRDRVVAIHPHDHVEILVDRDPDVNPLAIGPREARGMKAPSRPRPESSASVVPCRRKSVSLTMA